MKAKDRYEVLDLINPEDRTSIKEVLKTPVLIKLIVSLIVSIYSFVKGELSTTHEFVLSL